MLNRWELEKEIVIRALKDPAFKEKLIANPKEALRTICNEKKLSSEHFNSLNIIIHEEKKNEWTINIPYILKRTQETLSNEEMEKVSGGHSLTSQCACCWSF